MIAVMGASGRTGGKIVDLLLAAGEKVRALGRSGGRLAELQRAGAEVATGDTADRAFLTDAFHGADAVYTLLPTDRRAPDYRAQQDHEGETIVRAIRDSGVRFVVALSSMGADSEQPTGVIRGLRAQEARLTQLKDVNVHLLRPVSFFDNFYDQIPVIKHEGIVADSVEGELAIPMVASRDVAAAGAAALKARDWRGVAVRELVGPRDISGAEATRILGERIGMPDLPYVKLSYDDMTAALVQGGLSASFAELYVEMTRAFNEGTVTPLRTPENATPTTFEAFADEFARVYRAP